MKAKAETIYTQKHKDSTSVREGQRIESRQKNDKTSEKLLQLESGHYDQNLRCSLIGS